MIIQAAISVGVRVKTYISGPKYGTYIVVDDSNIFSLKHIKKSIDAIKSRCLIDPKYKKNVCDEGRKFFQNQEAGISENTLGIGSFAQQYTNNFHSDYPTNKKILSIFTSSLWEKLGIAEFNHSIYENEYDGIQRITTDEAILAKYNIVVRWHPALKHCTGNEKEKIDEIIARPAHGVKHVKPSDPESSYSILDQSACVITFGSTIGIEALYRNRKLVLLSPSNYSYINGMIQVSSHEQLLSALDKSAETIDEYEFLLYGFYETSRNAKEFKYIQVHNGKRLKFYYNNDNFIEPSPYHYKIYEKYLQYKYKVLQHVGVFRSD